MKRPPQLMLAQLPTPIQKLESLSASFGREIYIKRDDTTGSLLSGNKIRKLEFVLKDAVDRRADTVVTCGGLQSNHVRTTMVAGRRLGMKPFAVLRGTQPHVYDGNTLIISIMGAEIMYVTPEEYDEIDLVYEDLERELKDRGLNPYFVPEGASNALGCWGYIAMMEELDKQQKEYGLSFDSIFVAVGSGGTQAGMILGKYMTQNPAEIIGINVFKETRNFNQHITMLGREAIEHFEIECDFHSEDIIYFNDYIGKGYAETTDQEMEFILKFALDEGIILDQVYTGKACYGMADLLNRYPERFGRNILFIHTGGIFGLFPERQRITRLSYSR
ncbi:1-aminocyclopropane-1-carboxylate deaminase/D-cysteine desulfhydrase [candidate division KSB1 bacterium]